MKRALVTGGAGFIGAHLARALLRDGWDVTVLDDLSTGKRENVPEGATFIEDDIVESLWMYKGSFDVVFHLAAQSSYRIAIKEPVTDAINNIVGTLEVCRFCKRTGARLVFASSAGGVYGDTGGFAAYEDTPPCPTSPYGVSKLAAEEYIRLYARQYGVKAVILRLANVYGPGQDVNGEAGVIARFAGQAARGEPLTVRGDGRQGRDFVHVEDVVRAFLLAAETCEDVHTVPYTFNISSGIEREILYTAKKMQTAGIKFCEAIKEEPIDMCFNYGYAKERMGWIPQKDFTRGVLEVLQLARAELGTRDACTRSEAQISAQAVNNV